MSCDFDVWIDGFPRSANTFTTELFRMANPAVRIASHRHIPTFIVSALQAKKPGIMLLRKPEDAAISWAIFWNANVGPCLDYYVDFHRALKPFASELFVASFEGVTGSFAETIQAFNQRYGLNYNSVDDEPALTATWHARVEALTLEADGTVNEARVCRPSSHRAPVRAALRERLHKSPKLRRKLEQANELYSIFITASQSRKASVVKPPAERPSRIGLGRGLSQQKKTSGNAPPLGSTRLQA